MALGDEFPFELANTSDFTVVRPNFSDDYGDETGTPATVVENVSAIVVPTLQSGVGGGSVLTREVGIEELSERQYAILPPTIAALPREKDVASWTDVFGARQDQEVISSQRLSGIDGYESVILILGHRT